MASLYCEILISFCFFALSFFLSVEQTLDESLQESAAKRCSLENELRKLTEVKADLERRIERIRQKEEKHDRKRGQFTLFFLSAPLCLLLSFLLALSLPLRLFLSFFIFSSCETKGGLFLSLRTHVERRSLDSTEAAAGSLRPLRRIPSLGVCTLQVLLRSGRSEFQTVVGSSWKGFLFRVLPEDAMIFLFLFSCLLSFRFAFSAHGGA